MGIRAVAAYRRGARLGVWDAPRAQVQRNLLRLCQQAIAVERRHGGLLRVRICGTAAHVGAHGTTAAEMISSCHPAYLECMLDLLGISTASVVAR